MTRPDAVDQQLDSKNLGRLRRVANAREVWISESSDFTPWLAENIDVLGNELGMTLTVVAQEVPVGGFRLDLQAVDEDQRVVVIENQLERTDHSHLGQCLVYASGLDASTVVWISSSFRDEFRSALDWLNERTDLGIQFFGVEVHVVEIGAGGPRAPVFEVVSRPNDWQKAVKASKGSAAVGGAQNSTTNEERQDFFADVLGQVVSQRPSIRQPARSRGNWLSFASGPFGYWAISVMGTGQIRLEAYLDCGDRERNKLLLDEMVADESRWNDAVGATLSFERLDDKRASRIARYRDFDLAADDRPESIRWAAVALVAMFDAMNADLRSRATALRAHAG